MLSDEERRQIERAVADYEQRSGAAPEALGIVQARRGWVDDQAVRDIAELLEMSPDGVDDVATFYSLIYRRPVGRHVILLCDSISCWVTGFGPLRDYLCRRLGVDLGETTADGRFTVLPSACLGLCEQAPAMMIDRDAHGHLTPEKIDRLLEQYD